LLPRGRSGEGDLRAVMVGQAPGQGQRREHVPRRPAARQEHLHRVALLAGTRFEGTRRGAAGSVDDRPMFTRMPTAASVTTRDEPPKDTNASGTPATGTSPATPPRCTNGSRPNDPTTPQATS